MSVVQPKKKTCQDDFASSPRRSRHMVQYNIRNYFKNNKSNSSSSNNSSSCDSSSTSNNNNSCSSSFGSGCSSSNNSSSSSSNGSSSRESVCNNNSNSSSSIGDDSSSANRSASNSGDLLRGVPSSQQTIKNYIDLLSKQVTCVNSLPLFHQIPCASIVSYNVTSLSHYTSNQNKMNKVIESLSKRFEVIFLQETKLLAKENQALKSIASAHEVFYSNNLSNTGANGATHTAGVCTAISKKITSKYMVKVVELPISLSGHCLVLHISLPDSDFSIHLINIRLITPPQNKIAAQEQMIKDLHSALAPSPTKFTILGGDLNFVERAADTTGEFKSEDRPCWEKFKKHFALSECTSDLHSFFHKPNTTAKDHSPNMWSARLDRFYISHTEADLAVVKSVVVSDIQAVVTAGVRGINAHVPTSLHFFPRKKKDVGVRRISDKIIENKNFSRYTSDFWKQAISLKPMANPLERLEIFTSAMRKASKRIFQDHRNEIDMVVLFQKAVALYNHLSSVHPDQGTILRLIDNTPLGALIYQNLNGWCTTELKAFIDHAFEVAGTPDGAEEPCHEGGAPSPPLLKLKRKPTR